MSICLFFDGINYKLTEISQNNKLENVMCVSYSLTMYGQLNHVDTQYKRFTETVLHLRVPGSQSWAMFGCFKMRLTCYCSPPPTACPFMVPWLHTSTPMVTSMKLWQYTKLTTLTWWAGHPPCTAGFQGNYTVLMVFTSHNAFETYIKCTFHKWFF